MIANINTVALQGINIVNINVQIHMANDAPTFNIVELEASWEKNVSVLAIKK